MGASRLSIIIRDVYHPCAPYFSTGHWFYVDIINCDGTYLTWNGTLYRKYKLRQGIHDQIEVPPGCYIVRGYAWCNNVTCELAMVVVGCDETACVCLLPTGVRTCIARLITALQLPEIERKIPQHVENAIKALKTVSEYLPADVFPPPFPVSAEEMIKEIKELHGKEKESAEK
jgi:hypothetical protein